MLLAFDLDGCVIDNQNAVRLAYLYAGVRDLPRDWFHVGGWATPEQRAAKTGYYGMTLGASSRILPAGRVLLAFGGLVLTGCSRHSLEVFLAAYPQFQRPDIEIWCELTLEDKLQYIRERGDGGLYFDDWAVACERVEKETTWRACNTSEF